MTPVWEHRVAYHEVDGQKIVFNSHYFEWIDAAAYGFFRLGGWTVADLERLGLDFVVSRADLRFESPIRLDETVGVDTEVLRVGRSSFAMCFRIRVNSRQCAWAEITYVNAGTEGPKAIPDPIRAHMHHGTGCESEPRGGKPDHA